MGSVFALEGDTEHEVLHETAGGRLRTRQYLAEDPLSAYLDAHESPQYVIRTRKGGLTVDRGEGEVTRHHDDGYGTLAVVTSRRLLVVIGHAGGDESVSIPLGTVVDVDDTYTFFREARLDLETVDEQRYTLAAAGDLEPVVEYLQQASEKWASAARYLAEVDDRLERAARGLDAGGPAAAHEALEDVPEHLAAGAERLEPLGPGAVGAFDARAASRRARSDRLRRRAVAGRGAHAHRDAQRRWDDRDYRAAAERYERAIDEYRTALAISGEQPPTAGLRRRLRGAAAERELLRAAPLADATGDARVAAEHWDPVESAALWRDALEAFQTARTVEWPGDRSFTGDAAEIRAEAASAADAAVDAQIAAARFHVAEGDELAAAGTLYRSDERYERARATLREARELAREVAPAREADVAAARADIDGRLAREDDHWPPEPGADEVDRETLFPGPRRQDEDAAAPEGTGVDRSHESAAEDTPTADTAAETGDGPAAEPASVSGGDTENGAPAEARAGEPAGAQATAEGAEPDADRGETSTADASLSPPAVDDALRSLEPAALRAFVAHLWAEQGWATSVVEGVETRPYDVVAVRDEGEQRTLLRTSADASDQIVGRDVDRCAATRDRTKAATNVTLVTTGRPTGGARRRAADRDVGLVDREQLAELVLETASTDRLAALASA